MRKFMLSAAAAVAVCAAGAGYVSTAEARAIGGASAPSLVDCINRAFGDFFNACSSTKSGLFSLPVQNTGNKFVTVFGSTPSNPTQLSCQSQARFSNLALSQQTGFQSPPASGQSFIALPGVSLPGNGFLFVKCNLAASAGVNVLSYND